MIKFLFVKKKYYVHLCTFEEIYNRCKLKFQEDKRLHWTDEKVQQRALKDFNSSTEKYHAGCNNNLVQVIYSDEDIKPIEINSTGLDNMKWYLAQHIYYKRDIDFKELYNTRLGVTDEMIYSRIIEVIPEKPKTYPLFSNEVKFEVYGKYSPEILEIKWDGLEYSYKMRNIGHVYDFISESKLKKV